MGGPGSLAPIQWLTIAGLPRHPADWATQETPHHGQDPPHPRRREEAPFYHIIVTDSRSARDGRNIERLGYYNPIASGNDKAVELNTERLDFWVGQGAQMTDKVANLAKQQAVKA